MVVIAFFGCCGAFRESHCIVITFLVIIIVQVILSVLLFTNTDSFKEVFVKIINSIWDKRRTDPICNKFIENIQIMLKCCGKDGPTDYINVPLPPSCCSSVGTLGNTCLLIDANKEGCSSRIASLYEKSSNLIGGISIVIACVEVVGALLCRANSNCIRFGTFEDITEELNQDNIDNIQPHLDITNSELLP